MASDAELLRAFVREGSEGAFREMVNAHGGMVYRLARRRFADGNDAEEIVQTVFMVLARRARFVKEDRLAGWLVRVTYFACRDKVKRDGRRRRRETEAAAMRATEISEKLDEHLSEELDGYLNRLPEKERSAVVLRVLEERSWEAVGMAMGVSADAARRRGERGLERLRMLLGRRGAGVTAASVITALAAGKAVAVPVELAESAASVALQAHASGKMTMAAAELIRRMFWYKAVSVGVGAAAAVTVAVLLVLPFAGREAAASGPVAAVGAQTAPAATVVATMPAARKFSEVQEVISDFDTRNPTSYTDLDTGKGLPEAPARFAAAVPEMTSAGIDLYVGFGQSNTNDRAPLNLAAMAVGAEDWEASAEKVVEAVAARGEAGPVALSGRDRVYFFRTREGTFGILRLSEVTGTMQTRIEIKRVVPEVAAALVAAQQAFMDLSSPAALMKTYGHAIEVNNVNVARKCLQGADGVGASWLDNAAAVNVASYRLFAAASLKFSAPRAKAALADLLEIPEPQKLTAVKWVEKGDRATPAPGSDPAVAAMELVRADKEWRILVKAPAEQVVTRAPLVIKAASAVADRLVFNPQTTIHSADDVRAAYLRSLADQEALQLRRGREGRGGG